MLSTTIKLKCNAGKTLPKIYFQYPNGISPGDVEARSVEQISIFAEDTMAHLIFGEILPQIVGFLTFIFFLVAACFTIYAIVRHIYVDRLLSKKILTLKKLGKHPVGTRRKRYRARKKSVSDSLSQKSAPSKPYGKLLRVEDTPYYLDDLSDSSVQDGQETESYRRLSSVPPREIISFTSPPMKVDPYELPKVPKPIEIPGEPFPELPDAPATNYEIRQLGNQQINSKGKDRNVKTYGANNMNDTKYVSVPGVGVEPLKNPMQIPTPKKEEPPMPQWKSTFKLDEGKQQSEVRKDLDTLTEKRNKLREQWAPKTGQ